MKESLNCYLKGNGDGLITLVQREVLGFLYRGDSSNRQKGQAAKAPAWPLTLFPSFPELCPGSWLRSCTGPVPGQMAKMGKTAKEECGKRGVGVGEK